MRLSLQGHRLGGGIQVNVSKISASGPVNNLTKLEDFSGTYTATGGQVALVVGGGGASLKNNANNVSLNLAAQRVGIGQRRLATEAHHINPLSPELLQRAAAQLEEAGEIVVRLRKALDGCPPPDSGAGRCYRVCFMSRFARGNNTVTACQRSIVIPSARSREAAIETAKQRFAQLEGIPDWTLRASFIEAGPLEEDAAAG